MPLYVPIVQNTEENGDREIRSVAPLNVDGEDAWVVFSSRRLCEEFIEAFPVEVDGIRAVPREYDWPELTKLAQRLEKEVIRLVVFDPVMNSTGEWSSDLTDMYLPDYCCLLEKFVPMPGEVASAPAANLADQSPYPDDRVMEFRSYISNVKSTLHDALARIEELEI